MGGTPSNDGETVASPPDERLPPGSGWAPPPPPVLPETTVGWADTVWRHGAAPGAKLRWLGERLPVLRRPDALESLVSPYVTSWGKRADVTAVLRSDARLHRLDGLDDRALHRLTKTYGGYGWAFESYRSFGVWHDSLAGGWDGYWRRRPTRLRETVKRKGRGAIPIHAPPDLALMAVERVSANAWQGDEPYPGFVPAVIARGHDEGWARVYILDSGFDVPAVQLWLVGGGQASLAKTWHDREAGPRSPGTVLTAGVIKALAEEGFAGVDLGRGDDAYKSDWASFRAQRWGVVARPAATLRGVLTGTRHAGKRLLGRS